MIITDIEHCRSSVTKSDGIDRNADARINTEKIEPKVLSY